MLIGPRRQSGAFYKKRPAVRRPRAKKVSKALATAVTRAVRREIKPEVKFVSNYSVQDYNSAISSIGDMVNVIPGLTQGDDDFQRTGAKVTAKGLYVKGSVTLSRSNTDLGSVLYKPLRARMMIIRPKQYHSATDQSTVASGPLQRLLKPNTGTSNAGIFDGGTYSLLFPVNKDEWDCCYDKQFNLYPQMSNTGSVPDGTIQNAMHPGYYQFRKKIPVRKTLLYSPNNVGSVVPTNEVWYMVIGYAYMDQSSIDVVNTQVRAEILSTLYFTDD